jgi:hypothetical protein
MRLGSDQAWEGESQSLTSHNPNHRCENEKTEIPATGCGMAQAAIAADLRTSVTLFWDYPATG